MKITNKDLIQSYILTTAKYDYSVYEKRILYRIIELMQDYTQGKKLNERYSISKTMFDDVDIIMPSSAFLKDDKDQNYTRVKEALLSLNKKVIQYEDDKSWGALNLIERPEVDKLGDYVGFRVSPKIAKAFLDFSKGFSKYELVTAMQFESVYAMRFYELLSGQKQPITYSIENLKIMFQIEDKYSRINDFFRYVIDPAKKELDKNSPYSFEYKPLKTGRKITAIKFYPVYQPQNRDNSIEGRKLQKRTSLNWDLDKIIINYLKENYIFSEEEIKNNRELFTAAQNKKDFDLLYFLSEQKRNAASKKNPKGWIVNAIKKQIGEIESVKTEKKSKSKQLDLENMIAEIQSEKKIK
jgi:plasmid replication initiation protein